MRAAIPFLALLLPAAAPAATTADLAELFAADRGFAAAAQDRPLPAALAAMFADHVVMIAGGVPTHVRGKAAAEAKLAAGGADAQGEWAPAGGGISADGSHGYTYGRLTVRVPGRPVAIQKYLSWWEKGPDGWRVAAFVRRAGAAGPIAAAPPVIGRARHTDDAAGTLRAAEQAFSDRAQRIGLRAAFAEFGRAESINIGAAPGIAIGADAIAAGVAGPDPTSPVSWRADEVRAAPSGDLGISIGHIRFNGPPPAGAPAAIPFFTIWARPEAADPWRYVAE